VLGSDDLAGSVEVPETLRDAPRSAAAASNVSTCVHNIHTSINMSTKFSCGVVVNCRSYDAFAINRKLDPFYRELTPIWMYSFGSINDGKRIVD